jgi:gluconolactonase
MTAKNPSPSSTAASPHNKVSDILPPNAKLEKVFGEGVRTEGVGVAPDGIVYFSDLTVTYWTGMQAGFIWKYNPKTGNTIIFRSPSGMSNGIIFGHC